MNNQEIIIVKDLILIKSEENNFKKMNRYFLYCYKLKTINGRNRIITFRFTNLKKPANFPVNGKNFDRNVSTGYFYITSISFPTKWEMKIVEFYLPENFSSPISLPTNCLRILSIESTLTSHVHEKGGRRGEFRNLFKTYDANYECRIHSYSLQKFPPPYFSFVFISHFSIYIISLEFLETSSNDLPWKMQFSKFQSESFFSKNLCNFRYNNLARWRFHT